MDDKDLKSLQQIDTPLPSPRARDAAMRAGLQAFQQAEQKTAAPTQGSMTPLRLISNAITTALEWMMKQRAFLGLAAVAAIAVPVTFKMFEAEPQRSNVGVLTMGGQQSQRNDGILDMFTTGGDKTVSDGDATPRTTSAAPSRPKPDDRAGQVARREAKKAKPLGASEVTAGRLLNPAPSLSDAEAPASVSVAALPQKLTQQSVKTRSAERRARNKRIATGVYHDNQPQVILEPNRDQFEAVESNPIKLVRKEPVSTFSVDVDTASYAFARKLIQQGRLPSKHAVRTEEMINYFDYNYPRPENADTPFRSTVGVYPTPWNQNTKLIHIGIKGFDVVRTEKPRANLVFLLDVSGSMKAPDKLPLLKSAFRLLVDKLEESDTVSIVTYAGQAGTVLEPTKVKDRRKIMNALENLRSGGSTAGAQGIRQAYALAEENLDAEGVNRVILATDGDFNVGITDRGRLKDYIAAKRKSGVFLSVLGFGAGNYNDALMQTLAQNGNGTAAYIDTLQEAQKVLVEEAGSTLFPIAKDVKIQIEFNPTLVSEYRLIGYETRALRNEDFNNDKVDAGDIGSGHTVTVIYEITPTGAENKHVDALRYESAKPEAATPTNANSNEYAFLKLRYKLPKEDTSKLISLPVTKDLEVSRISEASTDMRFAVSVAAFGQKLRGSTMLGDYGWDQIADLATSARGNDRFGYRNEFVSLVRLAKGLAR